MVDWSKVPVFGARPAVAACVLRPSAYGPIADARRGLALVRTAQGTYLPGGGIEARETPAQTIVREALEERGLVIRPGTWTAFAVQFVYSAAERTHFEKRSTFIAATVAGPATPCLEADHELIWLNVETGAQSLSHQSQR